MNNLVIKGENLLVLQSLLAQFERRVRLIYIDPPYNTGRKSLGYVDRFAHDAWLDFMRPRLELARRFLSNDGSIWISIDDGEQAYLKVLCDEVFDRENFVSTIVWEKKYSPQNDARWFSDSHDYILVYARDKSIWRPNLLPRTLEMNARYKNRDDDPRGAWMPSDLSVRTYTAACDYPITTPSGRIVSPPQGRCWGVTRERLDELIADNRIWFGERGDPIPTLKRFLSEVRQGMVPKTMWFRAEVGDNIEAKRELKAAGLGKVFMTPKPERLLKRIIELSTDEGDLVMDFFAGSGTTAVAAHHLNRQFILIEREDYVESITVKRLQSSGASFVFRQFQDAPSTQSIETPSDFRADDNLIIKGENSLVLERLLPTFEARVKLICIDPPYNTGSTAFAYNDRFERDAWLNFMRRRLKLARQFLSDDGSIFVLVDFHEVHYLKVLMDEVFGAENFRNDIVWCYTGPSGSNKFLPRKHDNILYYARGGDCEFHMPYVRHKSGVHNTGQVFGNADGDSQFKSAAEARGKKLEDWWIDISSTDRYRSEAIGFAGQKPVRLLERIIAIGTSEGDLVMDFFAGSGTTAIAAHNLNRRFILVEQMDYIESITVPRVRESGAAFQYCNWEGI